MSFSYRFATLFGLLGILALTSGCSKSDDANKSEASAKSESAAKSEPAAKPEAAPKVQPANDVFDTSRLPRVAGGKQITASPAITIFTSPDPVPQTADALDKALAAAGWQKFVAPSTAVSSDQNMGTMSLKKGSQGLSVFITVAPAQNNATSVQYAALPLKTDLPFTADATNIEYAPDRALLTLVTAEPTDKTLDFYRRELATRGWQLWSDKLGARQPDGGVSGIVHRTGAYAHYINDKEPTVTLALTVHRNDDGKTVVALKELPIAVLQTGTAMSPAPQVDVRRLPHPEGATQDPARASSSTSVSYNIPRPLADTIATVEATLAADGWQEYRRPDDETSTTLKFFKKGPQGLSVSFYTPKPTESIAEYGSAWIYVDLPFPDAASETVFDDRRPYLSSVTAAASDSVLDFYEKELGAEGWVPLSAAEAPARWPNAKLDGKTYFTREKQKPILLSRTRRDDGKTNVEIMVAPFAQPQNIEADGEAYGMPKPKLFKTSGSSGGDTEHRVYAMIPAELATVLAFYRRELTARHWTEEAQGAVNKPDEVVLNFTSPDGPAVLTLGRRYDLTTVSLVQRLPKPVAKPQPAASNSPSAAVDSLNDAMKEMQKMMKDAGAPPMQAAPAPSSAAKAPQTLLRAAADSNAPVPVPDNAADVEFNGGDGRLEFSSDAPPAAIADFYRTSMKEQGWSPRSSVINNANMVVLNFAKAGKTVSFTIMRMGSQTNVSAEGTALKVALAKSPEAHEAASADDLQAEESGGLPVPKRHTMSEGTQNPFRRELKASVPLNFDDVLGFYRRELAKLNWKEQDGASVKAEAATVQYAAPDGPAFLKLNRKDDEISVNLVVKNPDAAAKAGILPKPGQGRVMLGNINGAAQTITFNKKPIKVEAGAGTKGPDGPTLDLTPGKYSYSIKLPGKPAQTDEVEVGADETWGLMIGPGGVLALQAY
jgi:hypothetical protein